MTRFRLVCLCLLLLTVVFFNGCGERKPTDDELVLGNWIQVKNRAYILLIINPKGVWQSSVRIADATSKIVKSKGDAKGDWQLADGQLVFTVTETSVETVWKKNSTYIFEIISLEDGAMSLREENGRVAQWKKTITNKSGGGTAGVDPIIPMKPIAVNLNKVSSNTKGRYLCLAMKIVLKELMPDQEIPVIHPKAREAAVVYLSSMIYDDVKDFDRVKEQRTKLVNVLNPYMEGVIKNIEVEHVIVTNSYLKVEEFIIEHTLVPEEPKAEGEEGEIQTEEGHK